MTCNQGLAFNPATINSSLQCCSLHCSNCNSATSWLRSSTSVTCTAGSTALCNTCTGTHHAYHNACLASDRSSFCLVKKSTYEPTLTDRSRDHPPYKTLQQNNWGTRLIGVYVYVRSFAPRPRPLCLCGAGCARPLRWLRASEWSGSAKSSA